MVVEGSMRISEGAGYQRGVLYISTLIDVDIDIDIDISG